MPGSILGTAVRRVEDRDLITGASTYVGNLALPGLLHLAFVRSPLAHGRIAGIDTAAAAASPGVVAVYTAADLDLPAHHGLFVLNPELPRPPLATDRVRFVGEAVAVVVGETKAAAVDAVELVEVDYDPLPAAVDPEAAFDEGAPAQFDGRDNLAAGQRSAPEDAEDALADAEVVVRARMVNQRVAVMSLEGNAIAVLPGGHDGRDDELTVWVSTQMPHGFRDQAAQILGLDAERVRVITPHVGGGFGGKAGVLAEHTVAIGVARALGRPVSWVETRSENLVSMPHGRGQIAYYELGLTREGRITGLRARVVGDAGAYAGFGGALTLGPTYVMSQGVYDIPKIAFDGAVALTNTTPMGAFRGAGRPEATAYLERMLDLAAVELAIDPAELRRRNFLDPASFPVTTLPGARYDVGDYDLPLREALRIADYDKLREEQRTRREARRPRPARHRDQRLRRDHRGWRGQRVRRGHRARRRLGDDLRRHVRARPGPRHRVRHARERPPRHTVRQDPLRPVRHRGRARAARAPAARGRCRWAATPCSSRPTTCWSRPAAGRPSCWRRPSTTSRSPTTASSA